MKCAIAKTRFGQPALIVKRFFAHFMVDKMKCEEHLEGILLEIDMASPKALPSLLEEFDSDIESLHNSDADPEFHPGTCEVRR